MPVILLILFVLWLCAAAYYLISAYCLISFYKSRDAVHPTSVPNKITPPQTAAPEKFPPITVLKPLKGAEEGLYENLKSFIDQDYPRYQIIFGVQDRFDPAFSVAQRLISEYPDKDMLALETGPPCYPNRKVWNLASMYHMAKYDIILVADSDMLVGEGYLAEVARDFDDPPASGIPGQAPVGLVTCPYRGCLPKTIGAAFETLTINADFFPSVTVAERLEGMSFAMGATMAARREALEKIGGFKALGDFLADDYQLGNKIFKAGYRVKLTRYVVDSVQGLGSFGGYLVHQLRWGRTYRACRPGGYFLAGLTKGTALAALFLALSGFSPAGWAVLAADLLLRNSLAVWLEGRYIKAPGALKYYWLLPVKDLVGAALWALSFMGNTVDWKGESFKITREGRMVKRA